MAKIRAYYIPDPFEGYNVSVIHQWGYDPYDPRAFHEIYVYNWEDQPPGYSCGQKVPTFEEGMIAAHTWASMPAMINDVCVDCRYWGYGANTARWNIYRGEEHPKPSLEVPPYPPRFIPGIILHKDDPWPPGYGPPWV